MYIFNTHLLIFFRIDIHFVIKVADFGLAASMDLSKDYYRQDEEVLIKLPIKWMSPESILDNIFSEKTDVVRGPTTLIIQPVIVF